ncbi:MAG: rod-binding protein [Nitrospira sp.]|nr:rod-binding protein [Nitrospira sp.]
MADVSSSLYGVSRSLPSIYETGEGGFDAGRFSALGHLEQAGQKPTIPVDEAESRRQLIDAGRQFETYFISYLLKVMRETVPQGAFESKQGAYFQSFYDQEIGIRAAESGGIGITNMVREYAEHYSSLPSGKPSSFVPESR